MCAEVYRTGERKRVRIPPEQKCRWPTVIAQVTKLRLLQILLACFLAVFPMLPTRIVNELGTEFSNGIAVREAILGGHDQAGSEQNA